MKKLVPIILLSTLFLMGCQKNNQTESSSNSESSNTTFAYKSTNSEDFETYIFTYNFEKIPKKLIIREKEYENKELLSEQVIHAFTPTEKQGELSLSAETFEENLTVTINIPLSEGATGGIGKEYPYTSMISWAANETQTSEDEMPIFAANWKTSEESNTLPSANIFFDSTMNAIKSMNSDEKAIIWTIEVEK